LKNSLRNLPGKRALYQASWQKRLPGLSIRDFFHNVHIFSYWNNHKKMRKNMAIIQNLAIVQQMLHFMKILLNVLTLTFVLLYLF